MRAGGIGHAAPWALYSPDLGLGSTRGVAMSSTQNAVVGITYTDSPAEFPAGSVVDHILVTCVGANPANTRTPQSVPEGTASVTFDNLVPDTYTVTAQGFPAAGPGWGTPVTATIVVTSTAISLSLPSALTLTQP